MGVMVRDVITVKPGDGMTDALELLVEHDVSALLAVDDGGTVIGVITTMLEKHRLLN